jgi:hypothetical protein
MADLYPGKVYVGDKDGGGWTDLGEISGPVVQWYRPEFPVDDLLPVRHGLTVSVTVARDALSKLGYLGRLLRRAIHEQEHSGSQSHCRACHPEQDRRPLAVDGHDYRRRQLNRQKRKNR